MKHVAPAIIERGGGSIVNTSSTGGLAAWMGTVPYIASKHAVIGMTKAAALELASRSVRVNAVCPGATNTDMIRRLLEGFSEAEPGMVTSSRTIPAGRLAKPDEVAAVVAFLCSHDASFINGAAY